MDHGDAATSSQIIPLNHCPGEDGIFIVGWDLCLVSYNNYQNDPLAVCAACEPKHNAENALSARSDLNPSVGRYPFFEMGKRPHGGTDAKVVNSTMIAQHSLWTQCGPTSIEKQSFSWSSSPFASVPHVGQPDEWNFPPALKEWAG
ncbi:hypothetical protein HPB50_004768 [Hyalomma asiaticum]|uniref:Uncharacterized protein n=1 Tax=Hyalomma asiaticum TaxID=266040 RepID=A0ACB7RQK9_HYAAI|nr:hypothetical protein HPB50_004768 [Hyalomma asiaticum]